MKYGLGYYDSHYAARAQFHDGQIISTDRVYDRVAEIKRINPYTFK
jgi:predicted nucleic acid-binding protein